MYIYIYICVCIYIYIYSHKTAIVFSFKVLNACEVNGIYFALKHLCYSQIILLNDSVTQNI